jgi:hypothetical protein
MLCHFLTTPQDPGGSVEGKDGGGQEGAGGTDEQEMT